MERNDKYMPKAESERSQKAKTKAGRSGQVSVAYPSIIGA
jgi:hypothetical protein